MYHIFWGGGVRCSICSIQTGKLLFCWRTWIQGRWVLSSYLLVSSLAQSFLLSYIIHGNRSADRNQALRWLRKATENKRLLSETDWGNLENYLSIISTYVNVVSNNENVSGITSILSAVAETTVPEHIAVLNNNDNDSSITSRSGTNSTSLSS